MTQYAGDLPCVREVWSWNFEDEFAALLELLASGQDIVLSFDAQFSDCCCDAVWCAPRDEQYEVICNNLDYLQPDQIGVAIAGSGGLILDSWNFNLRNQSETYTGNNKQTSLQGTPPVHDGVDVAELAARIVDSRLADGSVSMCWVTFAGAYDFGYLLKMLTGRPLPRTILEFDDTVDKLCPWHYQLAELVPTNSLPNLASEFGFPIEDSLDGSGRAGENALVTLQIFIALISQRDTEEAPPAECVGESICELKVERPTAVQWLQPSDGICS